MLRVTFFHTPRIAKKTALFIIASLFWASIAMAQALPAGQQSTNNQFMVSDQHYRYMINYIGIVYDFNTLNPAIKPSELPFKRLLIEITVETTFGGFDWLPQNPLITDNLGHNYTEYQVIIAPFSANSSVRLKYLLTVPAADTKTISIYEVGQSPDGIRNYKMSFRELPIPK
jgi:hypothetical protein